MEKLLNCKRMVTSDWHRNQAESLLKYALENDCDNALIYSVLESRLALERYIFNMSVLVKGNQLTNEALNSASKKNGILNLLKVTMVNYIKHLKFCNIILEIINSPFKVNIPNLKLFKRLITKLSKYCHPLFNPSETVEDPDKKWFIKGVVLVQETIKILDDAGIQGAMSIDSIQDEVEVLEVYNKYLNEEIDLKAARVRLKLMSPVLENRQLMKT
jgi:hypothetical protein